MGMKPHVGDKADKSQSDDEVQAKSAKADDDLRWQLYTDHKKQAWEDIQTSTDSYDQSLLTLSSGGLGLSIAFIKDIVPLHVATWLMLLYTSWIAFGLCILTTVVSFQIAIATQREHLANCWKVYVERDDSCRDKQGKNSRRLKWCTIVAGSLFVLALACTVVFAVKNVGRYAAMPDDSTVRRVREGRANVPITPVPNSEDRGRSPVEITPVPTQTTQQPAQPKNPSPKPNKK